jgi:hypothetical protein
MASGHANRANRPNTWLHRPATRREVLTCQLAAVHTWHLADIGDGRCGVSNLTQSGRFWRSLKSIRPLRLRSDFLPLRGAHRFTADSRSSRHKVDARLL